MNKNTVSNAWIRIGWFIIGSIIALFVLNGCLTTPDSTALVVNVSPKAGHPPFNVAIVAACAEEGGTYTLDVDGRTPVESSDGAFTATVNNWPWNASVTWTGDDGREAKVPITVKLENKRPVAHELAISSNSCNYHDLIAIDLRYREHGCNNGTTMTYSGVEDPDYDADGYSAENDSFTYNVKIFDVETGKRESVFYGKDRLLMGDEYVTNPIFYWFVSYSGATPIIPYSVFSPKCMVTPVPDPGAGTQGTVEKEINIYVKEWGDVYHWKYTVPASRSGCNTNP